MERGGVSLQIQICKEIGFKKFDWRLATNLYCSRPLHDLCSELCISIRTTLNFPGRRRIRYSVASYALDYPHVKNILGAAIISFIGRYTISTRVYIGDLHTRGLFVLSRSIISKLVLPCLLICLDFHCSTSRATKYAFFLEIYPTSRIPPPLVTRDSIYE